MSASASKKKRKEQLLAQDKPAAKSDKKLSAPKKLIIGIVAAVLALALIITIGLAIKGQKYKVDYDVSQPAMKVGDYEVSVPMFNYFYTSALNNYINSGYAAYGLLQSGTRLSEQSYNGAYAAEDAPSWEEELISETKTQISNIYNLYDAAQKAGYQLTDEDNDIISDSLKALKKSASANGYGLTPNWFMSDCFGPGCTVENYREYLELVQTAYGYAEQKEADFEPTDEEIAAEYAANPNDYDMITFRYSKFAAESETAEDGTTSYTDAAKAEAKEKAEAAAKEFPEDATETTLGFSSLSSYGKGADEWLFAAERKDGDIEIFADEEGTNYTVIRFVARELNDYALVDASVIAFAFDAEGTEPAEGTVSAEEKFNAICKGVKDGISVEDFAKVAEKNGASSSDVSATRHTYSDAINAFLFDETHNDGDIFTIADTERNAYYVIRYGAPQAKTYCESRVADVLHHAAEEAWTQEIYATLTSEFYDDAIVNAYTDRMI